MKTLTDNHETNIDYDEPHKSVGKANLPVNEHCNSNVENHANASHHQNTTISHKFAVEFILFFSNFIDCQCRHL